MSSFMSLFSPFSKNPLPATCYDYDFLQNIVFPTPANTFTNDHSYPPADTSLHHHHTRISPPIATDHHCPDTFPNPHSDPHPDMHPDTHPTILTDSQTFPNRIMNGLCCYQELREIVGFKGTFVNANQPKKPMEIKRKFKI